MAPSRRLSNGRSPLVNQQRQITSFFSKSSSSHSPSPSPSPVLSKQTPKTQSNPNPSRSPTPSPTTPSPLQTKHKKPLLVIGPSSPSTPDGTAKKLYAEEVVDKRIKVYWPLDQSWYEGCVKSFDKISGKHVIQYDDAEEELLDLSKEKFEWIEEVKRRFRRLRRASVIEDDEEAVANAVEAESGGGGDDSADEDWREIAEPEVDEDVSVGMDSEDEDDEEDEVGSAKRKRGKNTESRKRKTSGEGKLSSSKKSKGTGDAKKSTFGASLHDNGGKLMESKDSCCK